MFNRKSMNPVANTQLKERIEAMLKFKQGDDVVVGGGIRAKVTHFDYKLGTIGVLVGTRTMNVSPLSLEKPQSKEQK